VLLALAIEKLRSGLLEIHKGIGRIKEGMCGVFTFDLFLLFRVTWRLLVILVAFLAVWISTTFLRRTSTPRTFAHILKHWDWMFGMYLWLAQKGVGPKVFPWVFCSNFII